MKLKIEQIYEFGSTLLRPLTLAETYETVITKGNELLGTDYGSIFQYDGDSLQRIYTSLPTKQQIVHRKTGYIGGTFISKKIGDYTFRLLKEDHPELAKFGIKTLVTIPLLNHSKPWGVLSFLSRTPIHFSKQNKKTLEHFGALAMLGIRKAQLYNEAKKALVTRDEFIASASHELKTPLTTLYGYAQLLKKKIGAKKTINRQWLESLVGEIFRLTNLVNILLQSSNLKKGGFEYFFRKCSSTSMVKTAIRIFSKRYPQHKVVFHNQLGEQDELILVDEDKIVHIVISLLTNAAQSMIFEKPISVILSRADSVVTLEVVDEGIGIRRNDLTKVFSKYYKRTNSKTEGLGLSLYLAKKVIEKHRGTIAIQSIEGEGTTVSIRLPVFSE